VICLALDPGLSGALAIVDEERVLFVDDLPVHQIRSGKRLRAELDLGGLRELLITHEYDHVFIEQVSARPGQGVTSMFRFGLTTGQIIGLVAGLRTPYSLVTPQRWQRMAGCGPSPDAARQRAGQLYPDAVPYLTRKRDAGRADAILIARCGLELLSSAGRVEPKLSTGVSPPGPLGDSGVKGNPAGRQALLATEPAVVGSPKGAPNPRSP
jgi:crossover junction endodeoxyribonuclease RuvC